MDKPIQDAIAVIQKAKENLSRLLADPLYNGNLLEINANFKRIENRLQFMGGILTDKKADPTGSKKTLTSFMGKKLSGAKEDAKAMRASISPSDEKKRIYLEKVGKLYQDISNYPPQSILTNYRRSEDIMVLRGVAKRAGVEDFETRELTIQFVQDIITAIQKKEEEGETQAGIDAAVDAQQGTVLSQADIDADNTLQKMGAKVGDTIITDGKKKQIIPKGQTGK